MPLLGEAVPLEKKEALCLQYPDMCKRNDRVATRM